MYKRHNKVNKFGIMTNKRLRIPVLLLAGSLCSSVLSEAKAQLVEEKRLKQGNGKSTKTNKGRGRSLRNDQYGSEVLFDTQEAGSYPPYEYVQDPNTLEYNTTLTSENLFYSEDSTFSMASLESEQKRYIVKFTSQEEFSSFQWNAERSFGYAHMARMSVNSEEITTVMHLSEQGTSVLLMQPEQALDMQNRDYVQYVEEDAKRYMLGETTPLGLEMIQALQISDDTISNRKVCIIDAGYDISHPDLINTGGQVSGMSQVSGESWEYSGVSHGVHVAGIISAIGGNDQGIMGVARNGQINLHIVKVFDNNGRWTYVTDIVRAVEECAKVGANVVNMSLGAGIASNFENTAFQSYHENFNILFVAASGNQGLYRSTYPASYLSVMSVGAVDASKKLAWFSNRSNHLELVAPGVDVLSTVLGGDYANSSGTSMACAYVTGVAALIWSHFPDKTAAEIRQVLTSTAEDLGSAGRDSEYGFGFVRADLAFQALGGVLSTPSPTKAPIKDPTASPSKVSTNSPTATPSKVSTNSPTATPTNPPVVDVSASPTRKPTQTPTRKPARSPIRKPSTSRGCQNSPLNWHDADGRYFNCVWYSLKDRCAKFGDGYANKGKVAQQACCACGGGSVR